MPRVPCSDCQETSICAGSLYSILFFCMAAYTLQSSSSVNVLTVAFFFLGTASVFTAVAALVTWVLQSCTYKKELADLLEYSSQDEGEEPLLDAEANMNL